MPLFHKGPAVLIIPYGHLELPRTHLIFGSALARLYVPDDRSPLGDVGYAYSVVDGRITGRSCNSDVDKRYTPTPYLKPTKSQDAPPPAQDKMTKIDPAKYSLPCIPPPSLNYPPFLSFINPDAHIQNVQPYNNTGAGSSLDARSPHRDAFAHQRARSRR